MSDETVPVLPSTSDAQSPTDNLNLQDMFSQFLKTSEENQLRHQAELSAIKAVDHILQITNHDAFQTAGTIKAATNNCCRLQRRKLTTFQ